MAKNERNNMKKEFLAALVCAAAVLSFTGCNESSTGTGGNNYTPDPTTSSSTTSSSTASASSSAVPTEDHMGEGADIIEAEGSTSTAASTFSEPAETSKPASTSTSSSTSSSKPAETSKSSSNGNLLFADEYIDNFIASFDTSKPSETSKPASSSTSSSKSSSSKSSSSTPALPPVETVSVSGSTSDIAKVCGLVSEVEKSISACIVDTESKTNPYDVVYDYGKNYDAFVAACDWSKVFDADYYIKQFPMLALQYHNDKALLLKHFQTVGIHEGRQGNANFNVGTYKKNCDSKVSKAFGDNWEGYYFYYMLNYSTEKSVKTTGGEKQQKIVMTAIQSEEFKGNNKYRLEAGVSAMTFNSEAAAFANYRAYINAHDNYLAHDWMLANLDYIKSSIMPALNAGAYCENETETYAVNTTSGHQVHADCYRNSPSHYETMITSRFDAFGASNSYISRTNNLTMSLDTFFDLK